MITKDRALERSNRRVLASLRQYKQPALIPLVNESEWLDLNVAYMPYMADRIKAALVHLNGKYGTGGTVEKVQVSLETPNHPLLMVTIKNEFGTRVRQGYIKIGKRGNLVNFLQHQKAASFKKPLL